VGPPVDALYRMEIERRSDEDENEKAARITHYGATGFNVRELWQRKGATGPTVVPHVGRCDRLSSLMRGRVPISGVGSLKACAR
jgi:hypothetical protein